MDSLQSNINSLLKSYSDLIGLQKHYEAQVFSAESKMAEILEEQRLLEKSATCLKQVKPLLSASSIKQCESLANSAISTVFGFPYTVEYNPESQRFVLNKGDYTTDLAEAEGGGIITVVSAIYDLFLLIKSGCRKVMFYDEAWYAVSDKYFEKFINFMRTACKDLGVDILLISHDERLTADMVDSVFCIENGKAIKLK